MYNDPPEDPEVWESDAAVTGNEDDPKYFRSYDPFADQPALFQVFGDLEPVARPPQSGQRGNLEHLRESILDFANRYGVPCMAGEFIPSFRREVLYMSAALELWEAIRARDKPVIFRYLTWNENDGWGFSDTSLCAWLADDAPEHWSQSSSRGADQVFLRATEVLDMAVETRCTEELQMRPVRQPGEPLELCIEINNLLRVVWVQFAFAVAGDKRYGRCEVCNGPFEVAPGENRTDRRFCSDACRIAAYRRRKVRAQEMRAAGRHLRQIAREVGSNLEAVRRWVGEV